MNNIETLKHTSLGEGVAEREQDELQNYFVRTEAWEMLNEGRVDIIYGGKGTGKSALYLLLMRGETKSQLEKTGIYVIAGEEISGDPVFQSLNEDKNNVLDENSFRDLWKVYILTLIGNHIKAKENYPNGFNEILSLLKKEELIPLEGLQRIFKVALDRILRAKHTLSTSGTSSYTVTLGEPTLEEERAGKISIRNLLKKVDEILIKENKEIWILFDRLDAAFTRHEVETPALRALFRVYLDFAGFRNIKLKIFLRDDIWERITKEEGFREQSHITRYYHIKWNPDSLQHLILSRFFNNIAIEEYTKLKRDMLGNPKIQEAAFYTIFPSQVESAAKKPKTFDWILKRVQDGKQNSAPREVINLIKFAREQQVRLAEVGGTGSNPDGHLISANALSLGLEEVSKIKVETLWSEYPELRVYIELFRGAKTEHTSDSIKELFSMNKLNDVMNTIKKLTEVGFLQERKRSLKTTYWVPFIFRPFLSMSQGSAFDKDVADIDE